MPDPRGRQGRVDADLLGADDAFADAVAVPDHLGDVAREFGPGRGDGADGLLVAGVEAAGGDRDAGHAVLLQHGEEFGADGVGEAAVDARMAVDAVQEEDEVVQQGLHEAALGGLAGVVQLGAQFVQTAAGPRGR